MVIVAGSGIDACWSTAAGRAGTLDEVGMLEAPLMRLDDAFITGSNFSDE